MLERTDVRSGQMAQPPPLPPTRYIQHVDAGKFIDVMMRDEEVLCSSVQKVTQVASCTLGRTRFDSSPSLPLLLRTLVILVHYLCWPSFLPCRGPRAFEKVKFPFLQVIGCVWVGWDRKFFVSWPHPCCQR